MFRGAGVHSWMISCCRDKSYKNSSFLSQPKVTRLLVVHGDAPPETPRVWEPVLQKRLDGFSCFNLHMNENLLQIVWCEFGCNYSNSHADIWQNGRLQFQSGAWIKLPPFCWSWITLTRIQDTPFSWDCQTETDVPICMIQLGYEWTSPTDCLVQVWLKLSEINTAELGWESTPISMSHLHVQTLVGNLFKVICRYQRFLPSWATKQALHA